MTLRGRLRSRDAAAQRSCLPSRPWSWGECWIAVGHLLQPARIELQGRHNPGMLCGVTLRFVRWLWGWRQGYAVIVPLDATPMPATTLGPRRSARFGPYPVWGACVMPCRREEWVIATVLWRSRRPALPIGLYHKRLGQFAGVLAAMPPRTRRGVPQREAPTAPPKEGTFRNCLGI